MTQYYSQLTAYGEKYIAKQISNGKPLNFATMAVGDGNGQNTTPTATQTTLVHEVYHANTTDVLLDEANPNQVICEFLIPENVGDFWVREVGIFDETGKLVAVANTPENYKPVLASGSGKVQYYRIVLAISNSNNLTISLNQNIVYATRTEFKQLERNLSAPDGYRLIGQCDSIAQLRTIEPTENNQHILVKGYYAGSHKGGGRFVADFADNQTADNSGTVIVTAGGKRWKRLANKPDIYDFGWRENEYPNTQAIKQEQAKSLLPIAQYCFTSRESLIADNKNGKLGWLPDGTVVIAEGAFYVKKEGSKTIPDAHGWEVIPEFETIGNYKSGYDGTKKTNTTIRYQIWNGVAINVIEIKNPKLRTLEKMFAPDVKPDATTLRITPKEFAQVSGNRIVISCDGFRAPNGADWTTSDEGKPVGLQIANGKLYQDWQPYENRDEAIVMLKTGRLVAARKGDGITGQQWIERGALWSAAFVGFVVEGGLVVQSASKQKSARTVLGQKADGTLIIFCAEGITDSFGLTVKECGEFALSLGCQIAYCLDGGGSTQCWWKNCYANHSSDGGFKRERKIGSFLVINDNNAMDFDTGWQALTLADEIEQNNEVGVRWKQKNENVIVEFDVKHGFLAKKHTVITKNILPQSRQAYHLSKMKCYAVGDTGKSGGFYAGLASFSARASEDTPYLVGRMDWTVLNS